MALGERPLPVPPVASAEYSAVVAIGLDSADAALPARSSDARVAVTTPWVARWITARPRASRLNVCSLASRPERTVA